MTVPGVGGQPLKINEEAIKILEEAFLNNATDKEACFLAGISTTTLYNYQLANPEYVERKAMLKSMTDYNAKMNIAKTVKAGNIEASKYHLDRRVEEYKPKSKNEVELTGNKSLIDAILERKKNKNQEVESESC